jgi:hypothetical protein
MKILSLIDKYLKVLSAVFLVAGIFMLIFGAIIYPLTVKKMIEPVGYYMVNYEINIIPDLLYLKPITLTVFIIALGYLSGLEVVDRSNRKFSRFSITIIVIGSLFFTFLSLYEVLFNFMLWGSLISSLAENGNITANIDLLSNYFPNPDRPWNLVFATKVFTLLFFVSIATLIYGFRWKDKKVA